MSIRPNAQTKLKNKTQKRRHRPVICGERMNDKDGWTVLHIYGQPYDRGFAHGNLLYKELKWVLTIFPFMIKEELRISMKTYMKTSARIMKPILQKQFYELYRELEGISAGAKKRGVNISVDYLICWNAYLSMYSYYKDGQSQPRCCAFIACGRATEKGDIIMAHNTHSDFVSGQISNVVLYITPDTGNPFVMQTCAGLLVSTTDWFLTKPGIIGCETTILDIKHKPDFGTPYFCRIRKAMQYAASFDDFISIMSTDNAGDYTCSWLVGDIVNNEIMIFEQGLKHISTKRTKNGVFYGANISMDKELRKVETTSAARVDISSSAGARTSRLKQLLLTDYYGKLNAVTAKHIMADHYDMFLNKKIMNAKSICKHSELDPVGHSREPFYPYGCTDSKVVNSKMASNMEFMGRMGNACGTPFYTETFIREHPSYKKWRTVLNDMPRQNWSTICIDKV